MYFPLVFQECVGIIKDLLSHFICFHHEIFIFGRGMTHGGRDRQFQLRDNWLSHQKQQQKSNNWTIIFTFYDIAQAIKLFLSFRNYYVRERLCVPTCGRVDFVEI